jgi:hypothetical protein
MYKEKHLSRQAHHIYNEAVYQGAIYTKLLFFHLPTQLKNPWFPRIAPKAVGEKKKNTPQGFLLKRCLSFNTALSLS